MAVVNSSAAEPNGLDWGTREALAEPFRPSYDASEDS